MREREETFRKLGCMVVLYESISDDLKKVFMNSLNKNSHTVIFANPPKDPSELYNFYEWGSHYIYHPVKSSRQLYFIEKDSLKRIQSNMWYCVKKDYLDRSFKCN